MSEAIATKEIGSQLSVQDICEQVNSIQQVLAAVMKKGTHYDVVPGCGTKNVLLKPGAEKLALAFRLDLQTETEIVDLGNGHREYRSRTNVYHITTGNRLGSGMGSCSTLETKYRYRNENTGRPVPEAYWKSRDFNLLGGSTFTTRKIDGKWFVFQQIEYANPADYYNTCLKMAEKRSKVAAVLNATAASDLFTQDDENDEDENKKIDQETGEIKPPRPETRPPQAKGEGNPQSNEDVISDAQAKRFYAIAKGAGWDDTSLKQWLLDNYKIDSSKKITRTAYEDICEKVKTKPAEREPGVEG